MRELSLHILDVLQNAREAGSKLVWLTIDEDLAEDRLTIEVTDDGRGMAEEDMKKLTDPFFTTRTTRHVGLGLPLLAAAAERCNGDFKVEKAPGQGLRVKASFQHGHIDRAPLGDMGRTLLSFLMGEPFCDLVYVHRRGEDRMELDTRWVRKELDPIPLSHPAVREWLGSYMSEGEEALTQQRAVYRQPRARRMENAKTQEP
ncbi:MAG: ATP-binding protein [Thermodesulfobacteriota bacterium]